jgi:RNA polymerase sigma-70 factor (ECF subfamily)
MDIHSLEDLLERLNRGDPAAAERAFVEYEPYLRKVVRRLLPATLRSKFDSVDVVQSVYGDVLTAFRDGGMRFGSVARLRAFLVTATRNRFIDRVRQHERSSPREVHLSDAPAAILRLSPRPRPSQAAVAAELWDRLLALCPPEHHRLLRLRRRGATAQEIAAEIGIHEGSVRRILRDLAVRLACSEGVMTRATAR